MESTFSPEKYDFRHLNGLDEKTNELIKQVEIDYLTSYFTYTYNETGNKVYAGNSTNQTPLLSIYQDGEIFQIVLNNCNKRPNTRLLGKIGMNSNIFRVFELSENQGTPKVLDRWLVTIQTTCGMINEVNKIIEKKLSTNETIYWPLLKNASDRQIVSAGDLSSGPDTMLKYPKHAELLGGIAATFGTIEITLEDIFNTAAFGSKAKGTGYRPSPLGARVLKHKSLSEKMSLITDVVKISYSDPANEMIKEIFKHLKQTAEHRNVIIHSTWHESSHFEDVLFAEAEGGHYKYPIEEFQRIYDYSIYVRNELWDFCIGLISVPRSIEVERP